MHSRSNGDINGKMNTSQHDNNIRIHLSDVNRPQQQQQNKNRNNNTDLDDLTTTPYHNKMDSISKFTESSRKNIQNMLQEQLHQYANPDGNSRQGIKKPELVVAFKLLKNQAQIMNSALDDIYHKTRQDIFDLENLINSLLVCAEGENGGEAAVVDFVPSREVPV